MKSEILTDADAVEKIREYVDTDNRTAYYPVPAEWVGQLLGLYQACAGAVQALPDRKFVACVFAELSDVRRLTMIYREVEGGNTSGLPTLTVPSSWVVWLLAEYDRLSVQV